MYRDDDDGDTHHCEECGENWPGEIHCPRCDVGRCALCCDLIPNGTPFVAGSSDDVFCVECDAATEAA